MHFENLSTDWQDFFKPEFEKPYFFKLNEHINNAYQTTTVYPPKHLIFNAFNLCSINHIKVTDHIKEAKDSLFSFGILPPLKGKSIQSIFDGIEFQSKYVNVTYHKIYL